MPVVRRIAAVYTVAVGLTRSDTWHKAMPDIAGPARQRQPVGLPPIVVDATGGVWNEIVLPTPITIDPPRPFYVGQFDMGSHTPHIYLDNGWPDDADYRNNLYGRHMDSGHENERRWRIVGPLDLDGTPRRHLFMVRATIETFNEVAAHRFEQLLREGTHRCRGLLKGRPAFDNSRDRPQVCPGSDYETA